MESSRATLGAAPRRGAEEEREEKVLIGCCRGRVEMGLLARFWRSNALNDIGFYHCLNEKAS